MYLGVIKLLLVFGGVAFFTLLERKVLSYSQNRKGPNKVSFLGVFQPMSDAIKLIFKSFGVLSGVSIFEFFFFPLFSLLTMMGLWLFIYPFCSYYSGTLGILIFFVFFSMSVFPVLGSGWASNSKYSILGAIRGASQSVSYEVVLIFLFLWVIFWFGEKSLFMNNFLFLGFIFFFVVFIWLISMMCETNRAPFDFAEGESELVSGFKVEYGSFPFALLFLAEYGVILFFSVLSGIYFFSYLMLFFSFLFAFVYLLVRTSFPRFRYDLLMVFCWGVLMILIFFLYLLLNFLWEKIFLIFLDLFSGVDYYFFNFCLFQGLFVFFSCSCFLFSFYFSYFFGFSFMNLVSYLVTLMLIPSSVGKIQELKGLLLVMWGMFSFICIGNLFGLLPYVYGNTTKIYFVLFLSLWLWVSLMFSSFFYKFKSFLSHFCPAGAPLLLGWFLSMVEVVSAIMRPLTLTLRLVANMTTGHMLIGLLTLFSGSLFFSGSIFSLVSLIFLSFYIFFEIFISLVQGNVFFMLMNSYSGDHS